MKRFIQTIAAVAVATVFCFTTNLDAAPHHGGGGHVAAQAHVVAHTHVVAHAPVAVHAHAPLVVHNHPVHFHVRGYHGWASRCWFPGYGCYGYYCGVDQAWYYWYAPLNEYLPISEMSIYPPTPDGVAPVGMVPVAPGMPALPPGATFVPGPVTAPY
jgi:hypothetical protein